MDALPTLRRCIVTGLLLSLAGLILAPVTSAQSEDDFGSSGSPDYRTLPYLEIVDNAVGLQASLFTDWYQGHSTRTDLA